MCLGHLYLSGDLILKSIISYHFSELRGVGVILPSRCSILFVFYSVNFEAFLLGGLLWYYIHNVFKMRDFRRVWMCIAWFEYAEVLQTWSDKIKGVYASDLRENWNVFSLSQTTVWVNFWYATLISTLHHWHSAILTEKSIELSTWIVSEVGVRSYLALMWPVYYYIFLWEEVSCMHMLCWIEGLMCSAVR